MKTQHSQREQLGAYSPRFLSLEPLDTVGIGSSVLFPDTVLPEQFHGLPRGTAAARGEVALMRAVLHDAIHCYQGQGRRSPRRTCRLAKEAEAWFLDDDERWPCSFVNVCRVLGLDPDYVRRGLQQWSHRPASVPYQAQRRSGSTRQRLRTAA